MALFHRPIRLMAWALAACAALVCAPTPGDARAGWGAAPCGPVGPQVFAVPTPAPAPAATRYEWREFDDRDPDCRCLWAPDLGRQVGAYRFSTGLYRWRVGRGFGDACRPPIAAPERPALPGDLLPTGVVTEKIEGGEKYSRNGKPVLASAAIEAVQAGGQVPDDSAKPSLTVIGTAAETAPVLADLARPENAAARAAVVLQSYPPDATMASGFGFAPGRPAVYLQDAGGAVLYHEDSYHPERLIAAVRKADPLYDPKKDPNGAAADPLAALAKAPPAIWVLMAVGGLVWWQRRKA